MNTFVILAALWFPCNGCQPWVFGPGASITPPQMQIAPGGYVGRYTAPQYRPPAYVQPYRQRPFIRQW